MTAAGRGVVYALVHALLQVLPVDAAGRRVFDETLADWRRDGDNAQSLRRRVVVTIRNIAAVARVFLTVLLRDVTEVHTVAVLARVAAWAVACFLIFIGLNLELLSVTGPDGGALHGYDSLALLSVMSVAAFMPVLAFLSAAFTTKGVSLSPRIGSTLVVAALMLAVMGWVLPSVGQAFREMTFARAGGIGTPPRGLTELSFPQLVGYAGTVGSVRASEVLNTMALWTIATPVMLVLGVIARSLTGWRRIAGTILPLVVIFVPVFANLSTENRSLKLWGLLLVAVLVVRLLRLSANAAHTDGGAPLPDIGRAS